MKNIILGFLLIALISACIHHPKPIGPIKPVCNYPIKPVRLSNQFKLSFTYICRKGVSLLSCQGNVIWNNVIVSSITPLDRKPHRKTITVYVVSGENRLQFQGAGISDSYGLILDNVNLRRKGTKNNIVINNRFQKPCVGKSWKIFNNIPGWDGKGIEVGHSRLYVSRRCGWNSQVVELDGHKNYQITQRFFFDSYYRLNRGHSCENNSGKKSINFRLEFQYAARTGKSPCTSYANVVWNNVIIASITPKNHKVRRVVLNVRLVPGNNILQFDGASRSDSFGLSIDNVKLTSRYSKNLIRNGDFEKPCVGRGWKLFKRGIPGWKAYQAEVGYCRIYNSNWPSCNGQCIELDSTRNQRYTQVINIPYWRFRVLSGKKVHKKSC